MRGLLRRIVACHCAATGALAADECNVNVVNGTGYEIKVQHFDLRPLLSVQAPF